MKSQGKFLLVPALSLFLNFIVLDSISAEEAKTAKRSVTEPKPAIASNLDTVSADEPVETPSTDFLTAPGQTAGDGSADLILALYNNGPSLRKKSLALDLAIFDESGNVIDDLIARDFIKGHRAFVYTHPMLSSFLAEVSDPNKVIWDVFGYMNVNPAKSAFDDVYVKDLGMLFTVAGKTANHMQSANFINGVIHDRAFWVDANIRYGLKSNGGLISFEGDDSHYYGMGHGAYTLHSESAAPVGETMTFWYSKYNSTIKPPYKTNTVPPVNRNLGSFSLVKMGGSAFLIYQPAVTREVEILGE